MLSTFFLLFRLFFGKSKKTLSAILTAFTIASPIAVLELNKIADEKLCVVFRVNGKPTGYLGCPFHRIIKDFMIQGGDIVNGDGTGSISIYGEKFEDENFRLEHSAVGLLSMANSGPNTNACQFFITCAPCDWLDNKHVVFGHVVEGMKFVRMVENVSVGAGSVPKLPVIISMCGQFS